MTHRFAAAPLLLLALLLLPPAARCRAQANPASVTDNPTARLPVLAPGSVADPYYRTLVRETQPLGPRALLLGSDPAATLQLFGGLQSLEGRAAMRAVDAAGQPFKRALRIDTERKPQEWMTHVQSFTRPAVHRGDVLYVTAWVRAIRITNGKPEGVGRFYASEERGGNGKNSNPLFGGDFAIPQTWTRVHFAMTATRDFGDGDELKLMFTFGHTAQVVEIGGVAGFNFGPGVDRTHLPHAELALRYPGREPNAAWRKAARARIEKIRKAPLTVVVVDKRGKPVPNAAVQIAQTRHAFLFGSSLPVGMLPGQNVKPWDADFARTAGASEADKTKLQQTFLELFNAATTSVTWTVWNGGDARISRDDVLAGLRWLKANNVTNLNTQAVYPGPEFTPEAVRPLMTRERAAEFGKAVNDYIRESVTTFAPYIASVQIANEIEGRPDYTNVLGHEAVAGWFRTAKAANPAMQRMINGPYSLGEAVIRTGGPATAAYPRTEGLQFYHDLIAWLRKQGAPIDYIGFQNHQSAGNAPGPEAVLRSLDQFATLGLPIEITEFEVTLPNGNDPAQRAYQADYLRDFFLAAFSHPSVRGILLQDFWQPGAWQYEGASAFFNADWTLNPHGKVYKNLVLGEWRTRSTSAKTNAAGRTTPTHGFLGDYTITVTAPNGKRQTVKTTLPKAGRTVRVTLTE